MSWNLYKIRDMAISSGRAVFSIQQLANLTSKSKPIANVYASRLVRGGLAQRLRRGKITFSSDDAVNACQLIEPSYITMDSALMLHHVGTQVPAWTICATTKNSLQLNGLRFRYHKIPARFFYGYKRVAMGQSYILLAEAEKAVLDGLYLGRFGKKDLKDFEGEINFGRMEELAANFKGRGSAKIRGLIE